MTEMLFILTTVFVAYVVYVMVNDQKDAAKSDAQEPTPAVAPQATAESAAPPKEEKVATPTPAPPKPAAPKAETPTETKPSPAPSAPKTDAGKGLVRNPETGETASATGNYLFSKRWIKEALVSEGLLDKVYKNTEIDEATSQKIKEAQAKLAAMDKYAA